MEIPPSLIQVSIPSTFLAPTLTSRVLYSTIASTITSITVQTIPLYVSTLLCGTLQTNVLSGSTINSNNMIIDTILASSFIGNTIQTNSISTSSLIGSSIQTNTLSINSVIGNTIQTNTCYVPIVSSSTIQSDKYVASTVEGNTIQSNTQITNMLIGSTIQSNIIRVNTLSSSTTQSNTLKMNTITTNTIKNNQLNINVVEGSTLSADIFYPTILQVSTLIGNNIQTNTTNTSTLIITGSTLQTNNFNFNTIIGNIIQTYAANANRILCSTIIGCTIQVNTLSFSTVLASTIQVQQLNISTLIGSTSEIKQGTISTIQYSTIIGSIIQSGKLNANTIIASTTQINTLQMSSISSGIIQISTLYISSLTGSTIQLNRLQASTLSSNMIQSNTLQVSTLLGSTIQIRQLNISTLICSTINTDQLIGSSIIGSTIQTNTLSMSTIFESTLSGSTIITNILQISSISSSTMIGNNFQANKIMMIDGNRTLTTSGIDSAQLQYLTNLISQAGGLAQINTWTSTQNFSTSSIYFNGLASESIYTMVGLNTLNQIVRYPLTTKLGGTLTQNYIPYANTPSTISNSIIYRVNPTDIAIGQTTSAFPTGTGTTLSIGGLTQTTTISATTGTFSKISMDDKRSGLNGTLIPGNQGCNFYMGTMNNNGSGSYTDTLYLNSWADTSAGNINTVMFNKNTMGMRIYQGAVGATSNFTSYKDIVVSDVNSGNMIVGKNSNTDGITFGPNVTWNSYLKVGSGTTRIGTNIAHVIATNGNLHLDCATNTRSLYLNHYTEANSAGSGTTELYGAINFPVISQQTGIYERTLGINSDNRLYRTQLMQRCIYRENSVGWGGGVLLSYAFYSYSTNVAVLISGKLSYYVTGSTMANPAIRVTNPFGAETTVHINAFTNNSYNHVTFPFQYLYTATVVGWYSIYVWNAGNCITDSNDQLWINVSMFNNSSAS